MIVCRTPTADDVARVGNNLRPEIQATIADVGDTPALALRRTLDMSIFTVFAEAKGEPLGIAGLAAPAGYIATWGMPWCMTTPAVQQHRRWFMEETGRFIAFCLRVYPRLETFVDVRHVRSQVWLKRLGFTLYEPREFQIGGPLFHIATLGA